MNSDPIKDKLKDLLIVVSGIPRSGTSLLMQILQAGGMEVLADKKREPDRNNPKGYLEYEAVKRLAKDNSCLRNQTGKAVKVISHLLKHLPDGHKCYKIIFINRDMNEIIKSQRRMLKKDEKKYSKPLIKAFLKELKEVKKWVEKDPNKQLLNLDFRDVIKHPLREIEKIIRFIDAPLDKEKMKDAVDPSLYRTKVSLNNS